MTAAAKWRLGDVFLDMATDKHKTQSKQAKDEDVFSPFGDDRAMDSDVQADASDADHRKSAQSILLTSNVRVSGMKVADGFVQQARNHPSRRSTEG